MLPVSIVFWIAAVVYTVFAERGVCPRPPEVLSATVDIVKQSYNAGDTITYSCNPGYVPQSGQRIYTCPLSGKWPFVTFSCISRRCSYPGPLFNGKIEGMVFRYQSVISFSCDSGYILKGAKSSQCMANGKWSENLPECQPVLCPPPPISEFGVLSYRRLQSGNISVFQDIIKFDCLLPFALFGNETATCLANGNWSSIPECKSVECPYPEDIENGFMNFALRKIYRYADHVTYGCNPRYVIDGVVKSQCQKTGRWSPKPTCRAPCSMPIKRATVLYNEQKIKVQDHLQEGIQHAETIWFFCKNKEQHCSYTVPAQCIDGNLTAPACFKERGWFGTLMKTDVADLTPCQN